MIGLRDKDQEIKPITQRFKSISVSRIKPGARANHPGNNLLILIVANASADVSGDMT